MKSILDGTLVDTCIDEVFGDRLDGGLLASLLGLLFGLHNDLGDGINDTLIKRSVGDG